MFGTMSKTKRYTKPKCFGLRVRAGVNLVDKINSSYLGYAHDPIRFFISKGPSLILGNSRWLWRHSYKWENFDFYRIVPLPSSLELMTAWHIQITWQVHWDMSGIPYNDILWKQLLLRADLIPWSWTSELRYFLVGLDWGSQYRIVSYHYYFIRLNTLWWMC